MLNTFKLSFLNRCDELERSVIEEYFQRAFGVDMSDDVLLDLKKHVFPLHLGHASQAECAYSRIYSCNTSYGGAMSTFTIYDTVYFKV